MTLTTEQIAEAQQKAEDYLREKYGAYRGHFAWRELEEALTTGYLRAKAEQAAEIAELKDDLQFVERWAVHHGTKPHMTAEEVLSTIQHYPAIRAITKSYADGKAPDTFNPYAEAAELKAKLAGAEAEVVALKQGLHRADEKLAEVLPLAKFGAEVLEDAIAHAYYDLSGVCVAAAKLDLITELGIIPPNIAATIEQLLED